MYLYHGEVCHCVGAFLAAGICELLHCEKSFNALEENIAQWLASKKI